MSWGVGASFQTSKRVKSIRHLSSLNRLPLEEAPTAYKTFRDKEDGCFNVVLER
jgi:hypothetical protein